MKEHHLLSFLLTLFFKFDLFSYINTHSLTHCCIDDFLMSGCRSSRNYPKAWYFTVHCSCLIPDVCEYVCVWLTSSKTSNKKKNHSEKKNFFHQRAKYKLIFLDPYFLLDHAVLQKLGLTFQNVSVLPAHLHNELPSLSGKVFPLLHLHLQHFPVMRWD